MFSSGFSEKPWPLQWTSAISATRTCLAPLEDRLVREFSHETYHQPLFFALLENRDLQYRVCAPACFGFGRGSGTQAWFQSIAVAHPLAVGARQFRRRRNWWRLGQRWPTVRTAARKPTCGEGASWIKSAAAKEAPAQPPAAAHLAASVLRDKASPLPCAATAESSRDKFFRCGASVESA